MVAPGYIMLRYILHGESLRQNHRGRKNSSKKSGEPLREKGNFVSGQCILLQGKSVRQGKSICQGKSVRQSLNSVETLDYDVFVILDFCWTQETPIF